MTNQTNCRILLVEDEKVPMMVHSFMLTELGYSVSTAVNGAEAVNLGKEGYDIIFMDIGLPDFSGIEATKQIRQFEENANVNKTAKIIALTAYQIHEVYDDCMSAGMNAVANKPITQGKFSELIQKNT